MRPAAETRWADLALCSVTARSPGRRQVPVPACAVTRAGVWIGLAETIDARHARTALLERGVAAVSPAMAGAVIRAPTAVGTGTRGGRGQEYTNKGDKNERDRAHDCLLGRGHSRSGRNVSRFPHVQHRTKCFHPVAAP